MRPKFACNHCERVLGAPGPSRPVEHGLAGPALLTHVLVEKYGDHQPLYRQAEMYACERVDLDRSTLAGLVGASSQLLAPLVDSLQSRIELMLRSLSKKSDTAGVIRYALSHWRALTPYLDNDLLEIDNNSAERALRCVAMGRRNYLFAGSDAGGERAAAIYSLIGSAKLNGLDP